jgi:hypothetical protein
MHIYIYIYIYIYIMNAYGYAHTFASRAESGPNTQSAGTPLGRRGTQLRRRGGGNIRLPGSPQTRHPCACFLSGPLRQPLRLTPHPSYSYPPHQCLQPFCHRQNVRPLTHSAHYSNYGFQPRPLHPPIGPRSPRNSRPSCLLHPMRCRCWKGLIHCWMRCLSLLPFGLGFRV